MGAACSRDWRLIAATSRSHKSAIYDRLKYITESIRAGLKELILPEIGKIREENTGVKTILALTSKRLDDINVHLADQSRRIDTVREELGQRIDEANKRIDAVREELGQRIDEARDQLVLEIRDTNRRLDRLFEIIVRREEHVQVVERLSALERDVTEMKRTLAA